MTEGLGKKTGCTMVSLGDSYSSGEGIAPYYRQDDRSSSNYDWLAHRSEKSWPGMLELSGLGKMAEHKDDRWFFAAVSGAKTQHFLEDQEKEFHKTKQESKTRAVLPPQLDVLKDLKERNQEVDYVTVTIGGNDAGFADIMIKAGISIYLTLALLRNEINKVWSEFLEEGGTYFKIYKAYKDIEKTVGKQAHIIVAGYPKIISPEGSGFLFHRKEAELINRSVSKANLLIEAIVSKCRLEGMNITFVSVEDVFDGHGAYTADPFIEGLIMKRVPEEELLLKGGFFGSGSFHPNEKGARAYASCVQKRIDELELAKEGDSVSEMPSASRTGVEEIEEQALGRFMEASSNPGEIDSQEARESTRKARKKVRTDQYRDGYDALFLGKDYRIDLPKLSKEMEEDSTRMKDGSNILDYVHFSIVMCRSRGLAYFTAVNIDGKTLRKDVSRIKWSLDSRISRSAQYGKEVYDSNKFDRGHLVRRLDPVWGEKEIARQANADTFYYTNSVPQHEDLNQKTWLGLEDYLLNNAQNHGLQISVFTGPIFKEDDMVYREKYRIPAEFWKVVVMVKTDGKLSATAYIQSQENYLGDIDFSYGAYQTYQVPVARVEELTGLDFGDVSQSDPLATDELSGLLISEFTNIRL